MYTKVPWPSHVHYSQSIIRTVKITCTNITVSDKLSQYLNYAENCLKTHSRHPAQCSAAEDRRSWWPRQWWGSLEQDCCAAPPLRIPLLAVMRGTILTPFSHDRSLYIMSHCNLLESVTRFFLARFHSFFFFTGNSFPCINHFMSFWFFRTCPHLRLLGQICVHYQHIF